MPPAPATKPPEIRIEAPPASGKGIDTPAFHVAGFRIVGATAFPQKVLLEQLGPAGLALTLGQIQARAMELGTHYPLGEWFSASAVSTRTSGWVRPPSATAFWNVEVKR